VEVVEVVLTTMAWVLEAEAVVDFVQLLAQQVEAVL
jgi:hypothetical protein